MCITLQTPKTGRSTLKHCCQAVVYALGPPKLVHSRFGPGRASPAAPGARWRCAASMQSKNDPEGSFSSCGAAAAADADAGCGTGLAAPHYWEEEIFRGNELSAECRRVTHSGEGSAAATVPNAGRLPLAPPPSACAPDRRAGCLALQRRPGLLWADRAAPHAAGRGGGCALALTAAECAACRMRLSSRATARALPLIAAPTWCWSPPAGRDHEGRPFQWLARRQRKQLAHPHRCPVPPPPIDWLGWLDARKCECGGLGGCCTPAG